MSSLYIALHYLSGDWTYAYIIGGGLGLCLLILRIGVIESGIYKDIHQSKNIQKGNFFSFFTNWNRFKKYMRCIGIGLPTWFCIGILAFFSDQFGKALGIKQAVDPSQTIMWAYIGISAGDFFSGFLSHWLASRKKAIVSMMIFTLIGVFLLLFSGIKSAESYYFYCVWLGIGTGYWAMFVTVGSEQFGTNIRSTATTTIPNFVRGTVILMTLGFNFFKPSIGVILTASIIGFIAFFIGIYSTLTIEETHDKNLDFTE